MSYISQTEKRRMYKQLNQFKYEELYLGIDEDCQKKNEYLLSEKMYQTLTIWEYVLLNSIFLLGIARRVPKTLAFQKTKNGYSTESFIDTIFIAKKHFNPISLGE